jgi:hypothetical protein
VLIRTVTGKPGWGWVQMRGHQDSDDFILRSSPVSKKLSPANQTGTSRKLSSSYKKTQLNRIVPN